MNVESILIVALLIYVFVSIRAIKHAYRNGVCDGYQFAREPWNPGMRKAGFILHEEMSVRFHDIPEVPPT